jgi:simple sugar transport system permease protein
MNFGEVMDILYTIIRESFIFSVPLLIVALGGMFSEKSGVINIALEGAMVFGAFFGIGFIRIMENSGSPLDSNLMLILAGIISMIAGGLFSSLLAFSAINMKADQTIGGTALNLLAPAVVIYATRALSPQDVKNIQFSTSFLIQKIPFLGDIPVIGDIFFRKINIMLYIGIAIWIISWIVIRKTRFGLRLSACGEHPQAADSVGINVYHYRWAGTIISGCLAGLGGLAYIISSTVSFDGSVNGYGFLAIAVLIFGQWKPEKIVWAALFFGITKSFASTYYLIPAISNLSIAWFFKMLPFIATLIVLMFSSKNSRAPKSEGIPYDQGKR